MANPVLPSDFAIYGLPAAATTGIATPTIQAQLDSAWGKAMGILQSRGFPAEIATAGPELKAAVCEIAALRILTVRGFNPDEPAHMAVGKAHDDAIEWLKTVAAGSYGLGPTSSARVANRVATVYTDSVDEGDGTTSSTRGW